MSGMWAKRFLVTNAPIPAPEKRKPFGVDIRPLPHAAYLKECISQDAETGFLYWRERPAAHFKSARDQKSWNSRYAGKRAFNSPTRDGHLQGRINMTVYGAHRVIWKLETGRDPGIIDHINGNPSDNRFSNLREVTPVENGRNRRKQDNRHPYPGVSQKKSGRWLARIKLHGRDVSLGTHDTAEEAIKARKERERHHGFVDREEVAS